MMKRVCKTVALAAIVMMLTVSMVATAVSADDNAYHLLGGKYEQGISNVTCDNNVDVDICPELYAAVAAAVNDWDWHLGLLNEQYGVSWNMSSVTENGMIECLSWSNEEVLLASDFNSVAIADMMAYVEYYNGTQIVAPSQSDWTNCKIVFLWENLEERGYLHDFDAMKGLANHEIGHTLGLGDYAGDTGVIMCNNMEFRTAYVPTAADLNGVYAIYG